MQRGNNTLFNLKPRHPLVKEQKEQTKTDEMGTLK